MAIDNMDSIPIFIDLDEQELNDVAESCTPRKYPKNSMIILEEEFGDIGEEKNLYSASFKALKTINVEFVSITEIRVKTEMDPDASLEDATEAHQAYNRFMQAATSFNAKQRVDRAKAKAKKEAKAAAEKEMQS